MSWKNVRLIVSREIRDQLRDRRTIFVIAVLPLLLYPLLGMSFLQVTQFLKEHPTRIWVIGAEGLPAAPALVEGDGFQTELLASPEDDRLFDLKLDKMIEGDVREAADQSVRKGEFDAVVLLSPEFVEQMQLLVANDGQPSDESNDGVGPEIIFDHTKDKSRVARDRVSIILARWRSQIVEQTRVEKEVPAQAGNPFEVVSQDLSGEVGRRAALWSKILPFIIIIWAMTGAFYPAIDLCAGEKERGTLETLLSSPASRHEIVWGKLLTVMVFSMTTSLLNLFSMGLTGRFILSQLETLGGGMNGFQMGPPPLATLGWLVIALVPISALFSALSLALAAMARSSKEGQYYLMPLMLATLPLMMLPMLPAVELDLGNSLIPVTGVILLLRSLIEGQYSIALKFALPVISVTGVGCWLAIQWAIHQFQDENVLFHESERFNLKSWLIHLVRDRGPVPTVAQAFLCGVLLLIVRFFSTLVLPPASGWNGFVTQTMLMQIGFILGPPLLMALVLTRKPAMTLLLRLPRFSHLVAVALLAVFLHPVASALAAVIHSLYPLSARTLAQLEPLQATISEATSMWQILALMALLPAICEEIAFRGFMLSGLRTMKNQVMAVLVSSLFFAIAHPVLQQSLTAFALGLVIGYIALKTNSILPCIVFHFTHNALQLSAASLLAEPAGTGMWSTIHRLLHQSYTPLVAEIREPGLVIYAIPVVAIGALLSLAVLHWLENSSRPAIQEATELTSELAPSHA